jgi:hypothetical protein
VVISLGLEDKQHLALLAWSTSSFVELHKRGGPRLK